MKQIYHITYVRPVSLDHTRHQILQYNEVDQIIHRITLSEQEFSLLHALLIAYPQYCPYAAMTTTLGEDLEAVRDVFLSLNQKIAVCNLLVAAVYQTGFIVLHKTEGHS